MSVEQILKLAAQIARGLSHIHHCRIVYRDLQPANVLFDKWGNVRLVDFDTAVSLDDNQGSDLSDRSAIEHTAPEATAGSAFDERADLYSLGTTIYEMCCGHTPYTGTRKEILDARRGGPPPKIEREDLPEGLRQLVSSLLAADPEKRPVWAAEVVTRLETLQALRADLERFLASDETATLEFKASLRTPVGPPRLEEQRSPKELRRVLEREVIETLAAFLNTDGGTLLIGVKDDRTVIGIEVDYPNVSGSRDGWRLTFDNLVSRDLGTDAQGRIDLQTEPWEGHTVAVVRCPRPGRDATWIGSDLFVRRTASTEKLSAKDAVAWCRQRWGS